MSSVACSAGGLPPSSFFSFTLRHFVWSNSRPVVQTLVPELLGTEHKGSMGRVGVIGGSREYSGAPYYAGISALRFGADLAWVFCSKLASQPIKSYSPELMVSPFYDDDAEDYYDPAGRRATSNDGTATSYTQLSSEVWSIFPFSSCL